ncbi:LEA_2 domain-containing protein [Psidium guajava]|nr:LEA_2 domain-containing protein [Psidium guajava]
MPLAIHAKSDSEVTSVDAASSPPRSPRRPLYYVQSPSNHDAEKMSYGSSPTGSPTHPYYHCSPIHHSRESSTSRFSASLKNTNPRHLYGGAWRKLHREQEIEDEDEDEEDGRGFFSGWHGVRLYACFVLLFISLFTAFSLILWGASKSYRPEIVVKHVVFESFNVQAGNDPSGVPTDMLTLNSTVRIMYRNPATFFGVHVTSSPLDLHYFQLKVASGHMKKFYQSRKSQRTVVSVVAGYQVPLYGGIPVFSMAREHRENVVVPLNLTFVMRSRAYILGKLVKSKFYRRIKCSVTLRGKQLGKRQNLADLCTYH